MSDTQAPIRVVIADDCTLFRDGLAELCRRRGLTVVGLAADGAEAVDLAARYAPDVVLMDVDMPRLDGIAATAEITARPGAPRVIMLTAHPEDRLVFQAIKAGAVGYLLKCIKSEELAEAVRAVHRDGALVGPALAAKVLAEFRRLSGVDHPDQTDPNALTEGEMAVLKLVAAGKSNAEIGAELGLTANSVSNRLRDVFQKLHVENRTQAALEALRRGWATLEAA